MRSHKMESSSPFLESFIVSTYVRVPTLLVLGQAHCKNFFKAMHTEAKAGKKIS